MQKGFAVLPILLGILIVSGLVLTYLYFNKSTSTPLVKPVDQKNDLKTYTNGKLGFQFLYSKDLKILEDSEEEFNQRGHGDFRKNFTGYVGYEPGKFLGAVVVLEAQEDFETNPFTIWVFNNDSNLTIDEWYHEYWYYPFVWGDFTSSGKFDLAPKEEATISGQMGKSAVIDYREGKPKFIYISKDQKMYLFRIIGQKGEEILASFKFLK